LSSSPYPALRQFKTKEGLMSITNSGRSIIAIAAALLFAAFGASAQQSGADASAPHDRVVIHKGNTTLVLEPYAPNILRVSISRFSKYALAPAGYGIIAKPDAASWQYAQTQDGGTYRSSQLSVTLLGAPKQQSPHLLGQEPIDKFFSSNGGRGYANVRLRFQLPDGHSVLDMNDWSMNQPTNGAGNTEVLKDRSPANTITASVRIRRATSIFAISMSAAGVITTQPEARAFACLFLLQIRVTPYCGITRPRRP
jgi:hypothetical protein